MRLIYLIFCFYLALFAQNFNYFNNSLLYVESKQLNISLIKDLNLLLKDLDLIFNTENSLSELSKVNSKQNFQTSKIFDLYLKELKIASLQSDGYFDLYSGFDKLDLQKKQQRVIENALQTDELNLLENQNIEGGLQNLLLEQLNQNTIEQMKSNKLNILGVVDSIIGEEVYKFLKNKKLENLVVTTKGFVKCFDSCYVNISNPYNIKKTLLSFKTKKKDLSVITKGINNENYINPKTSQATRNFASLILLSEQSGGYVSSLGEAMMVMPKIEILKLLKTNKDLSYIFIHQNLMVELSDNLLDNIGDLKLFYK